MTVHRQTPADEEAVAWFVRLRDEAATGADREAFALWLADDQAHREAWNEIEGIWGGLGVAAQPAGFAQQPHIAAPAPAGRRPVRRWTRLAAAAVVLIAVLAGWRLAPAGLLADHRTGIAERRTVALPDGSQIELGPESALDVTVEPGRRHVRLIAGQAYFNVSQDARRPFVVDAGQGRVTVLGTAFDIKMVDDDAAAVVVTHNAVSVGVAAGTAVRLSEGQAVSYGRNGLSAVRPADLDAVQGWRHDQLVFHDAPLDSVIAELGRYRHGRVQLLGAGLGSRRVTAVFDARQPEAAIETIARSLDLRVVRATSLFVALSAW